MLAPCIPNLKGWKWNYCICLEVNFCILQAARPTTPLSSLPLFCPPDSPRALKVHGDQEKKALCVCVCGSQSY